MQKASLFLGIVIGALAVGAAAAELDEYRLFTSDGSCSFSHLSQRIPEAAYLEAAAAECPDGFLDGYADVTLFSADKKPLEQFYGFFSQGYWTGESWIRRPFRDRFATDAGAQSLTFELGTEQQAELTMLGQAQAARLPDGRYGAFDTCAPFRVLALTPHRDVFENEVSRNQVVKLARYYAAQMCPQTKRVLLFAAAVMRPSPADVFFFAEIDLAQEVIEIKRMPADVPLPARPVRHERGVPIMRVTPLIDEELPAAAPVVEQPPAPPPAPAGMPEITENIPFETAEAPPAFLPMTPEQPPEAPFQEIASPEKEISLEAPAPLALDLLPPLLTASRILQAPLEGTSVVHVAASESGPNYINWPVALRVEGVALPPGWGILSGQFSAPEKEQAAGAVRVHRFKACREEACRDVFQESP